MAVIKEHVTNFQAEPAWREGVLEIPGEACLHHGGRLAARRLAWSLVGRAGAPVVCALGGIGAGRRVCASRGGQGGWWSQIAGPGGALDTSRCRILGFDYLGSADSTAPEAGGEFPSLSTYDQADALWRLLEGLQLTALHAITGASYGGMVALAFAERYPEAVGRLVLISAADRPSPLATAWRRIQRRIVLLARACGRTQEGLELAQALAAVSGHSPEELVARFAEAPRREAGCFVFPVEEALIGQALEAASRMQAESFLCLAESTDLHRIDAGRIFVPTTAVAVREDMVVPLADVRALVARLPRGRLREISSLYGHDAFLKEAEQLRGILAAGLELEA